MVKRDREGGFVPPKDTKDVTDSKSKEPQEIDPSVEGGVELESPERITRAKEYFDKLVMVTYEGHAKPFQRKVEVFKSDSPNNPHTPAGEGRYERWAREDRGDEGLQTIELRTFPDEDNPDSSYKMSVSFSLTEDGKPDLSSLMLSGEWPFDLAPLQGMSTGAIDAPRAGVTPEGRRIQDFLYADGAEVVAVKEEGFTHVPALSNYRSLGSAETHNATGEEMGAMYEIIKDAYIGGKDGPKVIELVPEFGDLVESKS